MEIVYLPSAIAGLKWFRFYYAHVFPAGEAKARREFERIRETLLSSPLAGRPVGEADSRALAVPRTPFTVIYRLRGPQIQVLLLLDGRAAAPDIE